LQMPAREAILLAVIAKVRFLQHAADADDYYDQAEQCARSINDTGALAFVLHHRGYYEMQKQPPDYDAGRRLSDEAATLAQQLDRTDIHFFSLVNRGGCELMLEQPERALESHQAALHVAEQHHNHPWQASALQSIGEDYHTMGDGAAAQQAFNEALTLWRQSGAKEPETVLIDFMDDNGYQVKPA
jgi:tetratricopeptide (TPR) repeat protein